MVPTAETFDWWTDGREKKVPFFKKRPFGSDGSELDGYFRTLDTFFRTFGRFPDGPQEKKVRLKE